MNMPRAAPTLPQEPLVVVLPLRLPSLANARLHWARRAKLAREQRGVVQWSLACQFRWQLRQFFRWPSPVAITLTRIGPRTLDSDNLEAACKHVRDGVADALGMDDGDPRLTWRYEQRKGKWGVEIRIVAT